MEYHGIDGPCIDDLLNKMVIFHSYVELPEGIPPNRENDHEKLELRLLHVRQTSSQKLSIFSILQFFPHSMPDWFKNAEPWYAHTPWYEILCDDCSEVPSYTR